MNRTQFAGNDLFRAPLRFFRFLGTKRFLPLPPAPSGRKAGLKKRFLLRGSGPGDDFGTEALPAAPRAEARLALKPEALHRQRRLRKEALRFGQWLSPARPHSFFSNPRQRFVPAAGLKPHPAETRAGTGSASTLGATGGREEWGSKHCLLLVVYGRAEDKKRRGKSPPSGRAEALRSGNSRHRRQTGAALRLGGKVDLRRSGWPGGEGGRRAAALPWVARNQRGRIGEIRWPGEALQRFGLGSA